MVVWAWHSSGSGQRDAEGGGTHPAPIRPTPSQASPHTHQISNPLLQPLVALPDSHLWGTRHPSACDRFAPLPLLFMGYPKN